jgi:aminotransferase
MSVECERMGGVNLAQGVCDTELPPLVARGSIEAIEKGQNTYTRLDGVAPLREAIAGKLAAYNGIRAHPDGVILATAGATGTLYAAALALLDPGDEVILFEPFYGYHWNTMLSLRVVPVAVQLDPPNWHLDIDRLREAITPRTRALIVNPPSNPSGKVFSVEELHAIADVVIEYDLFVFTDEIYEHFLFDGNRHTSLATLPGMSKRTVTISGISKAFSATGWRVAYLTANSEWIPTIGYFHDLVYIYAPGPLQYGAVAGLLGLPASYYSDLARDYQRMRDQLSASLADAGLTPFIPAGAYYILADASRIPGYTAAEKARELLRGNRRRRRCRLRLLSPRGGEHLLRFCFGKKQEALDRACAALGRL